MKMRVLFVRLNTHIVQTYIWNKYGQTHGTHRMYCTVTFLKKQIDNKLKLRTITCLNHLIGCWQYLSVSAVCFWQPTPFGLNLVVAAVLHDNLCRVIATLRGRLLYVVYRVRLRGLS